MAKTINLSFACRCWGRCVSKRPPQELKATFSFGLYCFPTIYCLATFRVDPDDFFTKTRFICLLHLVSWYLHYRCFAVCFFLFYDSSQICECFPVLPGVFYCDGMKSRKAPALLRARGQCFAHQAILHSVVQPLPWCLESSVLSHICRLLARLLRLSGL